VSSTKAAQEYAVNTLDEIDYLLDYLDSNNRVQGNKESLRSLFPAVYLNPDSHRGEEELLGAPEMVNDFWPFDHSVVFAPRGGQVNAWRIRSIPRKEAAGKVSIPAPRIIRLDYAAAVRGTTSVAPSFFGIFPNNGIREISLRPLGQLNMVAGVMASSVSSYYDWHVVVGRRNSPFQVRLPATPTSAREFLSLRDVPDGYQRRAAIKHWVSKHERRKGEPEEYDVRAHLRGREEFTWGDYEGWVEPSKHDMQKSEALRG